MFRCFTICAYNLFFLSFLRGQLPRVPASHGESASGFGKGLRRGFTFARGSSPPVELVFDEGKGEQHKPTQDPEVQYQAGGVPDFHPAQQSPGFGRIGGGQHHRRPLQWGGEVFLGDHEGGEVGDEEGHELGGVDRGAGVRRVEADEGPRTDHGVGGEQEEGKEQRGKGQGDVEEQADEHHDENPGDEGRQDGTGHEGEEQRVLRDGQGGEEVEPRVLLLPSHLLSDGQHPVHGKGVDQVADEDVLAGTLGHVTAQEEEEHQEPQRENTEQEEP